MPRDWPDPRDDDRPVARWEIWLVAGLSAFGTLAMLWGWLPG